MLKHGNIARALSWGGLAGVMTLGSIVLPLAPTWGQEQPAPIVAQEKPAPPAADLAPPAPTAAPAPAPSAFPADPRAGQQGEAQDQQELAQARMTIAKLQRELENANARLAELESRTRQDVGRPPTAPMGAPNAANPFAGPVPGGPEVPRTRAATPAPNVQPYWRAGPQSLMPVPPPPAPPAAPDVIGAPGMAPPLSDGNVYGQYRVVIRDPTTGSIKEVQTRPLGGFGAAAPGASNSERLDKIEAQLRALMDEIAVMRQAPPAGSPPNQVPNLR